MKKLTSITLAGMLVLAIPSLTHAQSRNLLMAGAKIDDNAGNSITIKTKSALGADGSFAFPVPTAGAMWTTVTGNAGTINLGTLPTIYGGTGTNTTFTQGSVVFAGASGNYSQDNANFFWDGTNHRLGLGTTTPAEMLEVSGNIALTNGSDRTISIPSPTAGDVAGNSLTVAAASAFGATTGGAGGNVTITAGSAAGSGDNNGGNISLASGTATGAGTAGSVNVNTTAGNVGIGNASGTNTINGTTNITGGTQDDVTGHNLTLLGLTADAAATTLLTLDGSNHVKTTVLSGTADEGIVYSSGKYRLGAADNTHSLFQSSRFINLEANTLTYTGNVGGGVTLATIDGSGAGTVTLSGGTNVVTGTANVNTGAANASVTSINSGASNTGATHINDGATNTGNVTIGNRTATATGSVTIGSGGAGTVNLDGTTNINTAASNAKATNINTVGTGAVGIGNATGGVVTILSDAAGSGAINETAKNVNVTGITTVVGNTVINDANGANATTSINTTSGTGAVNIGNATTTGVNVAGVAIGLTGATTVTGTTIINASNGANTSINATSGAGTVAIGNSASTTNVLGATNVNTSGTAATSIGTSTGNVTIGNTTNTVITATQLKGTSVVAGGGSNNSYAGTITLVAGTFNYTVLNTNVKNGGGLVSAIILTYDDPSGGDIVTPYVSQKTDATSFRVTLSGSPASGSTLNYIIVNP